jgi:flavin-dependent dehydrogenase
MPRGRCELLRSLPDVYRTLLDIGAREVDARPKLPGDPRDGDEDLQYLAVRRPVLEWALRRAALAEPGVDVVPERRADAIVADGGRVTGVVVAGETMPADVVVDAMGRRSPAPAWHENAGLGADGVETSDCGVVYYSRYYRVRPGWELPDGPWFLSPRGDLGYAMYATFPGDNRTFAIVLGTPSRTPQWRALKSGPAYEAAIRKVPDLLLWVGSEAVEPITPVLPMAGLRNGLRWRPAATGGAFPVGDAYGHSDPVLAHGLAFALIHAAELTQALDDHRDPVDALAAYQAATLPALRERWELATALDAQRHRMWLGEPVDVGISSGDYALFSVAAAGAVATVDPDVARVFLRRMGLLDSTAVLDDDIALRQRIEEQFAVLAARGRKPAPSMDEMLAAITAAARTDAAADPA